VIVTDMLGCQVVDSVYITKINAPCIDPPTAFTPNGDQYNDAWQIDNLYLYPNVQVLVFNKWGNVVHEQNGTYEPWDGNINGQVAPSGTYFWVINPNYLDREAARGNVTIVK
jgi:gliding motility-associated-like protein